MAGDVKDIFIPGGPNGAGKTTAAEAVLPRKLRIGSFLNADEIASALSPDDVESVAFEAGSIMIEKMRLLVRDDQSFAFETTCSGKSYLERRTLRYSALRLNPLVWVIGEPPMERMLATPADAEIVLGLYELRTEPVMREARAWMTGEFWPATAEEVLAVSSNPSHPHSAHFRQVITYWEMAAAMVLHGAVSAELFVDCNAEGFFLLAKFAPILEEIRMKSPGFLTKTSELINRFSAAAQRYDGVVKGLQAQQSALAAR